MPEAFKEKVKGCPHCGSRHFERSNKRGFHPLARWYCHHCRGFFFRPKSIKQFSNITKSEKKSSVNFSYKHKH